MTPGKQVLAALQAQGFLVYEHADEVEILSKDGERQHYLPIARFTGADHANYGWLKGICIALQELEGFTPPEDYRSW